MKEPTKSHRKLRNYLIQPEFQLKFIYYFNGSGVLLVLLLAAINLYFYSKMTKAVVHTVGANTEVGSELLSSMQLLLFTNIGILALYVLTIYFAGIVLSHRVAGPLYAINKFVEKLQTGDFSERLVLRKGDELTEVAGALNELSESLNERFGGSQ